MSASPVFVGTPKTWLVQIATANTNRDGSGTLGTLLTASGSGARIDRISIEAAGTVTAGVVRIFLNDGTNTRLYKERLVAATTPSTTIAAFEDELTFPDGLVLPSGWSIMVSTNNAEAFNVFAQGGNI